MLGFFFIFPAFLFGLGQSQEYVPGTPGATWSHQEVLAVKSKLYSIFGKWGANVAMRQIYDGNDPTTWMDEPNAAKMLRLGFHDCLKYKDGSGGCDGCLNWEGVGVRFEAGNNNFEFENVGETNNNGLGYTVEVLEHIYTDAEFPKDLAPALNISLKASGKSRADLWALATIAAVEYGVETNNMVCDGISYYQNPGKQCNQQTGTNQCHSQLNPGIKFFTGRRDCTEFGDELYKATKHESHPNAVGSGKMTADFFEKDFGFTGRETVAIMGAHTMGRLHYNISLFRYLWTTRGQLSFNNNYYKNIVREPKYAFHDDDCTKITDAEGNVPQTRWVAHVRKDTKNGGPVQWIRENYQCPNCNKDSENSCCQNTKGGFCKADGVAIEDDPDVNKDCERYRFISGLDETALPSEIGLYFDFDVTDDGIPCGCPGLEKFNPDHFNISYSMTWSQLPSKGLSGAANWHWQKADPQCDFNTLEYPAGSTPLHQIFEEYAADNQKWVDEFVPALEKMLSNGYNSDDLVLAPDQYSDVKCPRVNPYEGFRYSNCYIDTEIQTKEAFSLISQLDGRAVRGKSNGNVEMWTRNEKDPKQLWVTSDYGQQLINVGTNLPLQAGIGKSWIWDKEGMVLKDARKTDTVMDRGWSQEDGKSVGTFNRHNGANQKFINTMDTISTSVLDSNPQQYYITSKLDNRVIEGTAGGDGQMMTKSDNNLAQKWIRVSSENGEKYINVQTKLPFYVSTTDTWIYDNQQRIVEAKDQAKALDRGWRKQDGQGIVMWNKHQWKNQKFTFNLV